MRKLVWALALSCGCHSPAWSAADPLDQVLAKLDRSAAAFKGMTADLKQTAHTAAIGVDDSASGTIRVKRDKPGETRMLVNFTQPDPKTVQLQARTLDIYLPNSKTVTEYSLGKNTSLIEQFLLLGFGTSRQDLAAANTIRYLGAETIRGQAAAHLELIPKSPDVLQHVQKIELWLAQDTGTPLQHKIFQPGGDYQLFSFENVVMNPPNLSDSSLKLKLPKGVKVERPQQ